MEREFSLERISRLVSDLEQELAGAPPGSPKIDALRAELGDLKRTLASPEGHTPELEQRLQGVRGHLDDFIASVEGEVLRDSRYLAELGRILGLM